MSGSDPRPPIAIVVALATEGNPIRHALANHPEIRIMVAGMGEERAYRAASRLTQDRPSMVISAGFAGGLIPELGVGEILIHCQETNSLEFPGDARFGKLICCGRPVIETRAKRELARATGAVAVDMESAGVYRAAVEMGVPFLAIKTISDPLDAVIPFDIGQFLDESGRPCFGRLLRQLIHQPGAIPALWRLMQNSRLAAKALADYLRRFVEARE